MAFELFKENIDFGSYFLNQLTLSSTLLGLLIATGTFILQSGFASFKYSRSMFLKYYVRQSKILFLLLTYNILTCLVFLYFRTPEIVSFYLHIIFSLVFLRYVLDFYSHKGYIFTINSTKFNPRKNRLRKYLRYIFNLGFFQVIFILIILTIIIYYPISFGSLGRFSPIQGFTATLLAFIFCVISIIRLLPQFFNFSEQEYLQKENNELVREIETDISKELVILKETLIENGRNELVSHQQFDVLNGEIFVKLTDKKEEAFFVIDIWTKSSDVELIVRELEKYSYEFFKDLNGLHIDVNNFVLSYFVWIDSAKSSEMYFVRSKRTELIELFTKTSDPKEFINQLKNKVIAELFRGV